MFIKVIKLSILTGIFNAQILMPLNFRNFYFFLNCGITTHENKIIIYLYQHNIFAFIIFMQKSLR